ncbi:MAG TPA: hypothetical protein VF765_12760 [Polyangiaceae bacterium]
MTIAPTAARRRLELVALFVASGCAVLYPHVIAWRRYGDAAPFKFFANDAFYYLNVAQRSTGLPVFSYDGVHPTNGFHPLWQWVLSGAFGAAHWSIGSRQELFFAYAACALFCAVGTGLTALAIERWTGSLALSLFAAVPGFYDLFLARITTSTVDPTESAPWSFVNGMETGLSVLFFGVLLLLLARSPAIGRMSRARLLVVSALVSAAILSRLDDVFLLVALSLAVWNAARTRSNEEVATRLALLGGLPAAVLAAYLAYNVRTTGMLLPVSGDTKRSLHALSENLHALAQVFIPTLQWRGSNLAAWDGHAWRAVQLVAPLLVASVYLVAHRRERAHRPETEGTHVALRALATYVVLKAAYDFVLVPVAAQGHWYFPLAIVTTNVIVTTWIAERVSPAAFHGRLDRIGAAVACLFAVVSGNAVVNQRVDGHYGDVAYTFWAARDRIDAEIAGMGASGHLYEYDDGILGFSLKDPTMSATGLAVDREASSQFRAGRCFDVAYERHFDVMSSVTYWSYLDEQQQGWDHPADEAGILRATLGPEAAWFTGCGAARFRFRLLGNIPLGRTEIHLVKFEPKSS